MFQNLIDINFMIFCTKYKQYQGTQSTDSSHQSNLTEVFKLFQ